MSTEIIVHNIKLEKYALLKKINPDYLNVFIEDIFENGYNTYVRSLMGVNGANGANGVNGANDAVGVMGGIGGIGNSVTEQKVSSIKGQIGENIVYDILIDKFPDYTIENTTKIPHSGDIQIVLPNHSKVIIEVKNYNKTIDTQELEKLKFDMKFNKCNYAIFISLNSGIVGKKRFQFESFYHDKEYYYILYVPYAFLKTNPNKKSVIIHNSIDDSLNNLTIKLEFCICIISNLSNVFLKPTQNHISYYNIDDSVNLIINELNIVYNDFLLVKQSYIKMDENIKKSLENNLQNIKDFETSIKSRISKLISDIPYAPNGPNCPKNASTINTTTTTPDTYIIKDGYSNAWNVYKNNNLCGRISCINNVYDFFIYYNNEIFSDMCKDYKECIVHINYILNTTTRT
jgi:hypothetical protein